MSPALLVEICCKSLVFTFYLLLLFNLVLKICRTVINEERTKTILRLFIVCLVCVCIAYGFEVPRLSLYGKYQFGSVNSAIFYIIRVVFESIGTFIWYFIILCQVTSVFMGTQFEIKQRIVWMHRCIPLLIIVFALIAFFGNMLQSNLLIGASIGCAVLFYMTGYYHLVYLFNSRLYKMMKAQRNSQNLSEQSPILNIMRRSAVLISIHAVCNTILFVVIIMTALYLDKGLSFIYFTVCSTFVGCYNALCIFLMLRINEKYYRCLCQICDKRFETFCNHITRNTELELQQMHSNSSAPHKESIPV